MIHHKSHDLLIHLRSYLEAVFILCLIIDMIVGQFKTKDTAMDKI